MTSTLCEAWRGVGITTSSASSSASAGRLSGTVSEPADGERAEVGTCATPTSVSSLAACHTSMRSRSISKSPLTSCRAEFHSGALVPSLSGQLRRRTVRQRRA